MSNYRTLSEEQINFIIENATKMRQCEIAEKLGLTKNKVYHYRKKALSALQPVSQFFKVELETPEHTWLI